MSVQTPPEDPVGPSPRTRKDAKAEAKAAKAQRPWYQKKRAVLPLGAIALIAVIGVATSGCGQDSTKTTADQSGADKSGAAQPKADCGSKATDECTPHVSSGRSVRVDALIWKVQGVSVTTSLGDEAVGLGEQADGRFVVVTLQVRSDRSESATLTDNVFQLEVGGRKYDPDNEGTVAAIGAGEEPLFFEDIGPDATVTGKVVFDVPPSVLKKKVEMRFNELGFGSTHGYIRLPVRSAV